MEVHHHPVPHKAGEKKNFKEYLLEGLMIFIAVTMGFFAESYREHLSDRSKEKEYMISMLEDLKGDTSRLSLTIKDWMDVGNSIDSVVDAITFPIATAGLPKAYRHMNEALNYWGFSYNERTLSQLKSSGDFLLIHNKAVADKMMAYDQFNYDEMKNIPMQHNKFYENATALRSKVFLEQIITGIHQKYINDVPAVSENAWIDSLIKENKVPLTVESQATTLFEFKNALIALKRDYDGNMFWGYTSDKKLMTDLIKLIQENYHLE